MVESTSGPPVHPMWTMRRARLRRRLVLDVGPVRLTGALSPIATPNFDALAADGLRFNNMHTTALCSPSRSCIITGPQPPQQRHGLHHRARHGLPRLQRGDAVRERHALGDPGRARLQHVHGRQVAPDARATRRPRPGRTTAGRWAAASSASTASWAATRASGTRSSSTTTTRSSRPGRPRRATT